MDATTSRHILDRLKRGVPPIVAIEKFSVGMEPLRRKLDALLVETADPRWFFVTSEYGEGKSHFHCYAKHYALQKGYAVASLDVNNDDGALHQPQRHLAVILDSLRSPLPEFAECQGFAELMRVLLEERPKTESVPLLCAGFSEEPCTAAGYDPDRFQQLIVSLLRDENENPAHSPYYSDLIRYLSAQDLVNKSWYGRFAVAFRLQVVQRLLIETGHKGLLLFIDEVDNVVRQISPRGHAGCFRTLGWYCSAPVYPSVRVIFASTPEVMEMLDSYGRGLYRKSIREQKTIRPEEVRAYNKWDREADAQAGEGWHSCPALTTSQRLELFDNISALHVNAWGESQHLDAALVKELAKRPQYKTPRRWVRTVVQILDLLQQNGDG